MKILVLNAGSSSQKSCLFDWRDRPSPDSLPPPLWQAQIDWIQDQTQARLQVKSERGTLTTEIATPSRRDAIAQMLATLYQGETAVLNSLREIEGVGHRVVHGGATYRSSVRMTPAVKAAIAQLCNLAPAHNPVNLEGIEAMELLLGQDIPQVAVFDTAFHSHMPPPAIVYPIPYDWFERGIRRYGFHGISHQYCTQRVGQILHCDPQSLRLITCHLGNGCSLAAVHQGRSIDTTMGFTPLEGLMMGHRSGSIDPGILIYLLRQGAYSVDELDHLLNKASGLQGVSGISHDLRQIDAAIQAGDNRAELAFEVYVHRLRSEIGSMLMSLGGLDALVFTGGVGENDARVRAAACEPLAFLGLELDDTLNQQSPADRDIATASSRVRVLIVHTQEEGAIAQETWNLLTPVQTLASR